MSKLQKLAAALLIALLLATSYGLRVTNPAPVQTVRRAQLPGSSGAQPADSAIPVIDENTLVTARRLARLAHTPEEQSLAQSAVLDRPTIWPADRLRSAYRGRRPIRHGRRVPEQRRRLFDALRRGPRRFARLLYRHGRSRLYRASGRPG